MYSFLSAGAGPLPPGQLDAVGHVEDYGTPQAPHDGEAAEIHHQVIVAEHGAPLREQHPAIAGGKDLVLHRRHVPGGHELAFLDIDRLAGSGCGHQQVGLAAEKGRDLQDVQYPGGCPHGAATGPRSQRTGRPTSSLTRASISRPFTRPGPLKEVSEVRLALSKEALKMSGRLSSAA